MGGGSRHPLVDTHLKSKKGFFSKGSIVFFGGVGGGGGWEALLMELCPTNSWRRGPMKQLFALDFLQSPYN